MISKNLNSKIFDKDVERETTRRGISEGLLIAGQHDKRIVVLSADLSESVGVADFKKKFPDRYVEVGVAEQNLVSVASGLAASGKIPFATSYAVFSPGRNWEQIRTNICYNDQPVKIIGSHGGLTVGPDGGSHQMLEDIALMRVLPNMIVICPCDYIETKKALLAIARSKNPVYIRTERDKTPMITTNNTPFEVGKAQVFFAPENEVGIKTKTDVGIIAAGPIIYEAILAAKELSENGLKVKVLNVATIKPLDEKAVIDLAHETGAIVTVENHQIAGGLGGVISECLAKHFPVPIEFVGVNDSFGQSGTPAELIKEYKLDKHSVISAVRKVNLRKK